MLRKTPPRNGPSFDPAPIWKPLAETMLPSKDSSGTVQFQLPLGDGAIPFIVLTDFGKYVHWALSHINESAYLDFGVATEHATGNDIAAAFTGHTGKSAKYVDIPVEAWNEVAWAEFPKSRTLRSDFVVLKMRVCSPCRTARTSPTGGTFTKRVPETRA